MRSRSKIAIIALACLWPAAACQENDPAPRGDPGGGGSGGGGGMPDAGGGDTDTGDTDTGDEQIQCAAGEVLQHDTVLCWLRCPLGQQVSMDDVCEGFAELLPHHEAVQACAQLGDGFQAATRQQMIALLGGCEEAVTADDWGEGFCDPCDDSAACRQMFVLDLETYWTATTGELSPWAASFASGAVFMPASAHDLYAVRCVRHGS